MMVRSVTGPACFLAMGLALLSPPPVTAQMTTGSYLGDGAPGRAITGLGFKPDVVLIKGNDFDATHTPTSTVVRTSTMPAGLAKPMVLDNALIGNQIQSLDANGFTVGNDRRVNQPGINFYWAAFKVDPDMSVGTYTGNGGSQSIAGLGFSPDYVIVMSSGARRAIQAASAAPVGRSFEFLFGTAWIANQITSLDASGFSVIHNGAAPHTNENGVVYHYVAWNAAPRKTFVGAYNGNGADNRNIAGVGFQPEYLLIKAIYNNNVSPANTPGNQQRMAQIAGDASINFSDGNFAADHIQTFQVDGFQLGAAQSTNRLFADCNIDGPGCSYFYVAFNMTSTNYRSIGTAGAYGTGTISVSNGSAAVTGTGGAAWRTANRGRGDVITIPCNDPPACLNGAAPDGVHYTVYTAGAETSLLLTQGYAGATASGLNYLIRRQFSTFSAWEDCIDGPPGTVCPYFPVVSASLVADDRKELGIAYKDSVFTPAAQVLFVGATTDPTHSITLTADGTNRHNGVAGAGVVIDGLGQNRGFRLEDNNYTIEWLEFRSIYGVNDEASILIRSGAASQTGVLLQNLLIHDFFDGTANVIKGIGVQGSGGKVATIRNVMIWNGDQKGIEGDAVNDSITIENCTVHGMANWGIDAWHSQFIIRNTISTGNPSGDFFRGQADGSLTGSNNTSSDLTAAGPPAVFANPQTSVAAATLYVDFTGPVLDLHLQPGAAAIDQGLSLAPSFFTDIDGGLRPAGVQWDRGADESGATTVVKLQSFSAVPGDGSVLLEWKTASELDNLGFYVYRGLSEGGPWARLTASLIPGLGSSATGQAYSYRDAGLLNGTRYFYRLEDVDATSKTTSHGPVSAVPLAGAPGGAPGSEPSTSGGKKKRAASASCPDWVVAAYGSVAGSSSTSVLRCTRHGDPEAVSFGVVSRDSRSATLELRTGGFYALHTQSGAGEPAGTVRVFVPGFDFPQDEQAAALPIRRALVDAVVGRRVQLGGVRALDLVGFKGLLPSGLGKAEMQLGRDGTVRAARRAPRAAAPRFSNRELATLLPSQFQGEQKSAVVEIAPLRFEAQRQQLVLAKRVLVRLLFTGREAGESGRGSLGRAPRAGKPVSGEVLARLYTTSMGVHAVSFEQLFPGRARGILASQLRLERQGEPVAFHLEPSAASFGPGSRLYFYAQRTASSTDFTAEVAFELVGGGGGVAMPAQPAAPGANAVATASSVVRSFETNRFYQPGLLEAPDPWLWEALASGATRVKSFSLAGVAGSGELDVFLQGASESGQAVDHHVSVSVNGTLVGEAQFAGKQPYRMSLSLPASLLHEGANELSLTNVADTGVSSLVFLDRFVVAHPQLGSLTSGLFEGTWAESGTATVSGLTGSVALVDVSAATGGAKWLSGYEASGGSVRFHAEAGHRYLVASAAAMLTPRVAAPAASTLRATTNRADYLLIAPRAFLTAAEPLLARRHDQGFTTRGVAFEEISDEFGHGRPSAEAIKGFLSFAFQSWARPSPRYVLLLGDSTYDPRNFIGTSQPSPLPALWIKTGYLWTVSDPRARRGERRGLAAGSRDRTAAGDDGRGSPEARREADRVGGVGPGSLGSDRPRGGQSRPRGRFRGERARHRRELPPRTEPAAAVERARSGNAPRNPGRARLGPEPAELRRPRRRGGVGERKRVEFVGRGESLAAIAGAPAADNELPERVLRGPGLRLAVGVAAEG